MYPQIKYIDSDGKTEKTDMSNKYFIMFQELDVQVNQFSQTFLLQWIFLPRGNNGLIFQKRKQDVAQERKWRQWVDNTFVHTLR